MDANRWITGIIGASIVLTLLYHGLWQFLVLAVGAILIWEYISFVSTPWLKMVGLIYIFSALGALWHAPWALLILVWLNDTGAYIVGKVLGGPRLCPRISPGKTWSGFVGGLLSGVLGMMLLGSLFPNYIPVWPLGIWFALSLASHLGDGLESWVKRKEGIKDVANYLPGHGGFLDRCDSLLGVGLMYVLLTWLW